ncbi:U3 snoRNP protein [Coemansia erecta]|nr:U3 snoRNP protein [Coemansia erecta]KAJ2886056.1 U3 snoRNP protein [Coemansia asiatica]
MVSQVPAQKSMSKQLDNNSDGRKRKRNTNNGEEAKAGMEKSKKEKDLELLVFGGEDVDIMDDMFGRMQKTAPSEIKDLSAGSKAESDDDSDDSEMVQDSKSESEPENAADSDEEEDVDGGDVDNSLFFIDTGKGDVDDMHEKSESEEDSGSDGDASSLELEDEDAVEDAAWVDDDMQQATVALKAQSRTRKLRKTEEDNKVSGDVYEQRLREQFQKVNPVPKWAAESDSKTWADDDSDMENDNDNRIGGDMLKNTKSLISKSIRLLEPTKIDIAQLHNANKAAPSQSAVLNVEFHPTSSVLLTAGLDKTLRLFEVDGKDNQKIQSIYFKDFPISAAHFIRGGKEVVVSGKRSWYYSVDVERGSVSRIPGIPGHKLKKLEYMHCSPNSDRMAFLDNGGQIHMVSTTTKQFIGSLSMNGPVRDVSFTSDGNYLWSTGLDNEVYQWDLRQNRCLSRWHDSAVFRPTCLEISPDSSYYATGDNSGTVNIYDTKAMDMTKVRDSGEFYSVNAFKMVDNLTTSINGMRFNKTSEILGIYSHRKANQIKLVHLPTGSVFANWPYANSKMGYIQCLDFSPNSGFMAVGNDSGKALLFRLSHYQTY